MPDDLDSRLDAIAERLDAIADDIRTTEMLDSVAIVVTYQEAGQTARTVRLSGNTYASIGAMREYLGDEPR